jgi:methionyl-tRNA formyltransferase
MRLYLLASPTVDDFWEAVLEPLLSSPDVEIVGAAVDTRPPVPALTKLRRELTKGRGGYLVVMAVKKLTRALSRREESTVAFLRTHGIEADEIEDLYAGETLALIRARRPDCLFRFGFGFIREPVLSLAPKGVVSYHHGDIRRYRGQPVGFWELLHGESEMGVTMQVLNERLDAGKIVVERRIPIHAGDSLGALERRAYEGSADLVHEACRLLDDNAFVPLTVPDEELGEVYTTPNLRTWLVLQARVAGRKARVAGRKARVAVDRTNGT